MAEKKPETAVVSAEGLPPAAPGLPPAVETPVIEKPDDSMAAVRERFLSTLAMEDENIQAIGIALRMRGYTAKEIAAGLNVSVDRVRRNLARARRDGRLVDIQQHLLNHSVPLALEKLDEKLEDGVDWAIRETLRGSGTLRTYASQQSTTTVDSRELKVIYEMPASPVTIDPRNIVGIPRGATPDAALQKVREPEAAAVGALPDRDAGAGGDGSPREGRSDEAILRRFQGAA